MRFVHVRSAPVSSCPRMAVVISRSYMMGGGGWIVSVCNDLIHMLLVVVCVGGIVGCGRQLKPCIQNWFEITWDITF